MNQAIMLSPSCLRTIMLSTSILSQDHHALSLLSQDHYALSLDPVSGPLCSLPPVSGPLSGVCGNWSLEFLTRCFAGCIIRRLFARTRVPHTKGNSMGGSHLLSVKFGNWWRPYPLLVRHRMILLSLITLTESMNGLALKVQSKT